MSARCEAIEGMFVWGPKQCGQAADETIEVEDPDWGDMQTVSVCRFHASQHESREAVK